MSCEAIVVSHKVRRLRVGKERSNEKKGEWMKLRLWVK